MRFAIPLPHRHSLSIIDSDALFPVNRIFCIGRNYAAHAKEMGQDPKKEPPFFFMKPSSAIVHSIDNILHIPYPPMTHQFHHEIELVAAIGEGGHNIPLEKALGHVYGYAIGMDMTRRDLQQQAREKSQPWELAKAFTYSAPMGSLYRASKIGHPTSAKISLKVNTDIRQQSNINQMTWSVSETIAYLSCYEILEAGDLIMTGTPEGVSSVMPGDILEGEIQGLGTLWVRIDPHQKHTR